MTRGSGWDGYTVHFTETCDDPAQTERPHLITEVTTTDATVNDAAVIDGVHGRLAARRLQPNEHFLDAGYTSAELLLEAPAQRGITVVGPVRPDTTPQATKSAGFGKEAFTIDWQAKHAVCPRGATSRYWTEGRDHSQRDAIRIRFATDTCTPCPVRSQCTRSTRYGRQLTIRPPAQNDRLEQVRAEQSTEDWKKRYAIRAGVEGTIHQAVAATDARRTRYIGLAKTHLGHVLTAAAINLIRLDAWWNGTPLAPARTPHLARLDLARAA